MKTDQIHVYKWLNYIAKIGISGFSCRGAVEMLTRFMRLFVFISVHYWVALVSFIHVYIDFFMSGSVIKLSKYLLQVFVQAECITLPVYINFVARVTDLFGWQLLWPH